MLKHKITRTEAYENTPLAQSCLHVFAARAKAALSVQTSLRDKCVISHFLKRQDVTRSALQLEA